MKSARLLLVIPCYNEEAILHLTYSQLKRYYDGIKAQGLIEMDSKLCFVNDGSRDRTWEIIEELSERDPDVMGVKLSRNFGHQSAIMAGLENNIDAFDCFITIDADLQDDINAITGMIEKHREGAMVVYGVRGDRSSDSWFKRSTAEGFYKLMQKLGNFREINLFLRGIVPLIGFRNDKVIYNRLERQAGETKYPLSKMLLFAWNGITSFSTFPMRLVLYFGVFNFLVAMVIVMYILLSYLIGYTVPGWTSTMLPLTFFSGSNMMALGLIGEYIGKIYEEVKGRPRYIIEKITNE
jgi:glycosyltransferase involved in cell wall biosynthesis